jgi:hypothetical protein
LDSSRSLRGGIIALLAFCLVARANSIHGQAWDPAPGGQSPFATSADSPYGVQQPMASANPLTGQVASGEAPPWYITVESLFLWRDNRYSSEVGDDFSMGVGPRIFAGLRAEGNWELQAGYFGSFGMEAGRSEQSNGISLKSELNNAEVNFLDNFEDFALLAGFRYVGFNDQFDFRSGRDFVSPDVFGSEYKTSVKNNLYGGQLGLRLRHIWERFIFEATGKAGIFYNTAQADAFIDAHDPNSASSFYNRWPSVIGHQTGFVGDLNFTGGFRISPIWSARAGYNLLWINNIALAPDRIAFDNYTAESFPVYMERTVFMQGVNVGLEAMW